MLEIRLYATMSLRDILRLKVDKFFVEKCWVYGIKMSFLFFGWREALPFFAYKTQDTSKI